MGSCFDVTLICLQEAPRGVFLLDNGSIFSNFLPELLDLKEEPEKIRFLPGSGRSPAWSSCFSLRMRESLLWSTRVSVFVVEWDGSSSCGTILSLKTSGELSGHRPQPPQLSLPITPGRHIFTKGDQRKCDGIKVTNRLFLQTEDGFLMLHIYEDQSNNSSAGFYCRPFLVANVVEPF